MHDDHDGHGHPAVQDRPEQTYSEKRVEAIQALLVEKRIMTAEEVRRAVEEVDSRSPALGAKVVAKAWMDPAFKARLLSNARAAIAELGIDIGSVAEIVAVENTERVHHVVVCTLCSCYPRGLLGYPPDWYKSLSYRSRMVIDPRGVLKEFGLELDPSVEVRVLDSTADMRYLVIPERPAGAGEMSEEGLASLVTRDSMIGVARARPPARP